MVDILKLSLHNIINLQLLVSDTRITNISGVGLYFLKCHYII